MKYIEIHMAKTTLYLTEPELVCLLSRDPELWREAIRRGKMIKRRERKNESLLEPRRRG